MSCETVKEKLSEYEKWLKFEEAEKARKKEIAKRKFAAYIKKYQVNRYKTDDKFRLDRNISRSIRRALKNSNFYNKENHWKSLLGYTIKELKERLISTIPEGYNWQDYLDRKLELDHIRPVGFFKYTNKNDTEFRISWGLNNLRLLPKKINRIKSGSLHLYKKADCLPCLK